MKESPYIAPPQKQQKESGFNTGDARERQSKPFFFSGNSQQPFFSPQRSIIQRAPADNTGTLHGGVADQYRRSRGLTGEEGPSDAEIAYQLSNPVHVLNHGSYASQDYSAAVNAWPNDRQIWSVLDTPNAKVNFIRFILNFDQTNCRPNNATRTSSGGSCQATATALQTFENACQGYATQMYTRYTSAGRMDTAAGSRLLSMARIEIGSIPLKFHIPIFIATVPGHAFNAVQIANDASDVHAYIFFEPQNDRIFTADDPLLRTGTLGRVRTFTLSQLTGFNERGQYEQRNTYTFIRDNANAFTGLMLRTEQKVAVDRIMRDLFIVDDAPSWSVLQRERSGISYETYVRETVRSIPDDTLAMVFPFLNGRSFRRAPGASLETMNRSVFITLMNRPALERLIH